MLQVSTGFKTMLLGPHAFTDIFARGAIKVFDSTQPATADAAEPISPLGYVTIEGNPWSAPSTLGNGLLFTQSGPYIYNRLGQIWIFNVTRSGIPRWARLLGPQADAGGVNYNVARMDFSVSADPSDQPVMLLPAGSTIVHAGDRIPLSTFFFTIPPLVNP